MRESRETRDRWLAFDLGRPSMRETHPSKGTQPRMTEGWDVSRMVKIAERLIEQERPAEVTIKYLAEALATDWPAARDIYEALRAPRQLSLLELVA